MSSPVGFRVMRVTAGRFVPITVNDDGSTFEHSVCVCADQAAAAAQRGGSRPLPYLGMFSVRYTDGTRHEVTADDRSCDVSPTHNRRIGFRNYPIHVRWTPPWLGRR